MAEGKKSFIVYSEWKELFESLEDAQCAELIRHIFRYVKDENPVLVNPMLKPVWTIMQPVLKRDLKKWEEKKTGYSDAGKESGKSRRLSTPQLYVLRFYNDDEEFIKVGITDYSIGRRYSSSGSGAGKIGYKFDILFQYFPKENERLIDIERAFTEAFREHSYSPQKEFAGHMECYNIAVQNEIVSYLTTLNDVQQPSTKRTVNANVNVNVNANVVNTAQQRQIAITPMPTTEDLFNSLDATGKQLFEMFRRVTDKIIFSDHRIILEVNKFRNRYPDVLIRKSGPLVNTWTSNMKPETEQQQQQSSIHQTRMVL